jgi:hypothetical protein
LCGDVTDRSLRVPDADFCAKSFKNESY